MKPLQGIKPVMVTIKTYPRIFTIEYDTPRDHPELDDPQKQM